MSKLTDFLIENKAGDITEEVILSARLKDFPFKIKAMTSDEFDEYQNAATKISKGKKVDFNNGLFRNKVIINHTLEPNFKDADFIKKSGCATPEQLINSVLLAGEAAELSQKISEISGFGTDMDELINEAKNS